MSKMKKIVGWGGVTVIAVVVAGVVASWQPEIAPLAADATHSFSEAQIARGKTLADLGDCAVCHTRAGGERNTGGLAMEIPFGTIYTTNITPDVETGIGSWSYAAFERAMRHGVDRQGRYLYPAFPYTAFTRTRDDDLQALYAYLMSQPPVKYRPPATDLHFPFNIRQGIFAWNLLFLTPGAMPEQATQSADWNRGAYLVEGLGHCSACHSPRNVLFGEKTGGEHRRRRGGGMDGAGVDRPLARAARVDAAGSGRFHAHRLLGQPRRRRRPDGAGDRRRAVALAAGRSAGDRRLSAQLSS